MAQTTVKYPKGLILVVALAIAVLVSLFCRAGTFQKLELLTLDYRFLLNSITPPTTIDYQFVVKKSGSVQLDKSDEGEGASRAPGIIFVDMPETGTAEGTSLSSDDCSMAVRILTIWGARAVVFTTIFPEPTAGEGSSALMETVSSSDRVYLPVLFEIDSRNKEDLYAGDGVVGIKESWGIYRATGTHTGHINAFTDIDRKLRRVPAVIRYRGQSVYQLGLRVAFDMMGVDDKDIELDPEMHSLSFKNSEQVETTIPLGPNNQLMINWGGIRRDNVQHISFRDLMESYRLTQYGIRPIIDTRIIKDKICMLGSAGSNSITGTPARFKGYAPPNACALIINSVFEKAFIRQTSKASSILLVVLVSMLYGSALASTRVLRIMMMAVIATALFSVASIYAMPKSAAFLMVVFLAVPLGIFFARFHLFSGFLFTIFSISGYIIVSAGLFKVFNLAISTFYPIFAIFLIFLVFYAYTRLADYLGTVHLFNLATKDGLTSLYNRRHLNLLLDAELNNAILHKSRKMVVIMCDIDNFKKLNDTHGHQAGDAILRDFAAIMKAKCRQSDIVGRYGGEEFLIVLHGAGAAEGLKVAEGIRAAVADRKFTFKGQAYSTSLSMGLAEYKNEKTKEELVEKADQALYRAKKEGKNRVCKFE